MIGPTSLCTASIQYDCSIYPDPPWPCGLTREASNDVIDGSSLVESMIK